MKPPKIKSVAVVGAGAAGAVSAAALAAEDVFDVIRVFERRETPGGTWIYDSDPTPNINLRPGELPPSIDPPLGIPGDLPRTTAPSTQHRYDKTPIYAGLTSNVPDIAMAFTDRPFAYGPFVPHWIPKQYIEDYFSAHGTDSFLALNTTVEEMSRIPAKENHELEKWRLTLRKHDFTRQLDVWWEEEFDAVILANGHYSVPYVPVVDGLNEYIASFPDKIIHSRSYRSPETFSDLRVLVIGNSASGKDVTTELVRSAKPKLPIYQSRRSPSRWDGPVPPTGVEWKPIIQEYDSSTGAIRFEDGTDLADVDVVIYCTGYKPSYPFWNTRANGGPLFDYAENRLVQSYQHTFSQSFPQTLGLVGFPRVLTFRSFEYQAVALARLFAGRNAVPLPPLETQKKWENDRADLVKKERRKFHDILWDNGETMDWFRYLFYFSGLPALEGWGRFPPVLGEKTRWAIEHVRKYPEPEKLEETVMEQGSEWVVVESIRQEKDSLHFL